MKLQHTLCNALVDRYVRPQLAQRLTTQGYKGSDPEILSLICMAYHEVLPELSDDAILAIAIHGVSPNEGHTH